MGKHRLTSYVLQLFDIKLAILKTDILITTLLHCVTLNSDAHKLG